MAISDLFYRSTALALCTILQLLITTCSAGSCFDFDGAEYTENKVCPGSSACYGYNATCLPNRLCHNDGDPDPTLVRGLAPPTRGTRLFVLRYACTVIRPVSQGILRH